MNVSLYSAPAAEPLDAAAVKTHSRISTSADDTYIGTLIVAARRQVEAITGRSLINQTWDMWLDAWPDGDSIWLPFGCPLASVTGVYYTGSDGVEDTLAATYYDVDTTSEPGRVVLGYGDSWPTDSLRPSRGIRVRYVAGYGSAGTAVPADLLHAVKMLAGHWYENREPIIVGQAISNVPWSVNALLDQFRVFMPGDQP
ncbi:MAG: hypothetical protein RL375_4905 [Pseudomonadota bacterium]|jgi:uncharacterized phiE125 gp8 family phage protein